MTTTGPTNNVPEPVHRLTDPDILEAVEAAYEYAVWAADIGLVDFDPFAELARVIAELRARAAA